MKYALATALILSSTVAAQAFHISIGFGADGTNAVICTVKEVSLLAQSAEECSAAGGSVSHLVKSVEN